MRQVVGHLQIVDVLLDALPMMWLFDTDGSQVLRCHSANGRHIITGSGKQIGILFEAKFAQPIAYYIMILIIIVLFFF